MTLSKRDAKLLLILLGIAIMLAGYFAVYNPYISRTETVEAETAALQPQLTELQGYYQNLDSYNAETEDAKETIAEEMSKYPTDVRQEDLVMYTVGMEESIHMSVTSITVSDPAVMLQFGAPPEDGDAAAAPRSLTAFRRSAVITCNLSYQNLKDMIDYINGTSQRTALDSVTVTYDAESGKLTGGATFDKYFITGDGDAYSATNVPNTSLGKSDLFGTMLPTPAKAAD